MEATTTIPKLKLLVVRVERCRMFIPRMRLITSQVLTAMSTRKIMTTFSASLVADAYHSGSDLLVDFDLMMTIPLLGPFFLTMTQLSMPWILRFLYTPEF